MSKMVCLAAQVATIGALVLAQPAFAAEGGTGFYLLGSKTTMAGYLPGPGFYGSLTNYFYSGSGNINYQSGGVTVSGGVNADAYVALPTALWVLDQDVLGGKLGFSLTMPIGGKLVNADALLTGPGGGVIGTNYEKDHWDFGDPVFGAVWGGHSGNFHYTFNSLVNVPVGPWEKGNPVNISFHRWALDTTAALTYLNPNNGVELSGAMGFTFNGENPGTNYRTGTEFHLESAAMLHVSHQLSFGLGGYFYEQLTGDSGSGAVLGAFKGQVVALGPALDYTFLVGKTPVVTNLRYFHEFDTKNRLQGDAGFLTISIPLGGQTPHK
jgi:hypothetical protein